MASNKRPISVASSSTAVGSSPSHSVSATRADYLPQIASAYASLGDDLQSLHGVQELENELKALNLEMQSSNNASISILRERTHKSEAWIPPKAFVDQITTVHALHAERPEDLRDAIAEANMRMAVALEAESQIPKTQKTQLSEQVEEHRLAQQKASELEAANETLQTENQQLLQQVKEHEVAQRKAIELEDANQRLQTENAELSTKMGQSATS